MRIARSVVALSVSALFAMPALAQQVDEIIQRNANHQERIEQGLRSGQLTVEEAAALERRAARVESYQARALADGHLSSEEAQRIDRAQDRFGRAIRREATDAISAIRIHARPSAWRTMSLATRTSNDVSRTVCGAAT